MIKTLILLFCVLFAVFACGNTGYWRLASDHFSRLAFSTVSVFGDVMVPDSVSLKLSR